MKKFSELDLKPIIENYIDYSILQHLAIKYKEHHKYSRRRVILEKYGIYDGCEELSQFIYNKIKKEGFDNQYEFSKDELKDFKNIFFNKIIIDIDSSEDIGAEYIDNEKLNKDLLFDEVIINIYLYKQNINNIKELLMHELTHAYNNYMMCLKKDDGYIKTSKSILYNKIVQPSSNDNEKFIKKSLYLLLGYEQNAFFAQIKAELEKNKDKVNGPNDALKILKGSLVYQAYQKLDNQISKYFKNELSDQYIKEIEDIYNEITGENKNANQIFKKLKALSSKTLKKLDHQLPKLCIENLNNISITDDTKLFEYLKN